MAKKPFKLIEAETKLNTNLSKSEIKDELKEYSEKLSKIQDTMYAHNKYDVVVHSFKTPSESELEYDFLWRHYLALPERGKFAVYNRNHYKNMARLLVAKILCQEMLKLTDIKEPPLNDDIKKDIDMYKELLAKKEI